MGLLLQLLGQGFQIIQQAAVVCVHLLPLLPTAMKNLFGHKYVTPQEVERCRVRIGGPGVLLFLEGMEEERQCGVTRSWSILPVSVCFASKQTAAPPIIKPLKSAWAFSV